MSSKFTKDGSLLRLVENIAPHSACWLVLYLNVSLGNFILDEVEFMFDMFSFLRSGEGSILGEEDS